MKSVSISRSKGFTIVELLIVIVVIAILASISVVAYNGIQRRSRNTARIAAAQNIHKQLELYTLKTGSHFGSNIFCIPTEANYDAGNGGLPDCYADNAPRSEIATVNSNFSAQNTQFSYPDTPTLETSNGVRYYGIHVAFYNYMTEGMNGLLRPNLLFFFLEGSNEDCGANSVTVDAGLAETDPLNSILPARNFTYSSAVTWCALSLTHHSTI